MTPNQITLIRIFLVPFMIFFYLADFIPYGKLIAVIIFALAAITDFIDGKLARKTGKVTDLGKFLDPIADKVLVMSALILVVTSQMIVSMWGTWAAIIAIIIIAREFLVSLLRQVAASKNIILSADNWGKYKAFLQDLAIPAFMLLVFFVNYNILTGTWLMAYIYFCYLLIAVATLLTIISGINYFIKNKHVFCEGKEKNNKI
ncbi:MAG: CDP-diacylglycerol--glycerol-3-phosphate 3-phosphatidyltransferase [Clostridia bacterium]|nr:CDP-diacylglycerol--glycerol-3-phosphate 3-phosphatidyltransferase [Clostridia bacterium]MDD4685680.1 CDP-diacylglycerol--glycerol-3-phosphate 3-phosphatidyltransferase [Clostridia bacterium]